MGEASMPGSKVQVLKAQGALNAHPELVTDELFVTTDFFDPNDLVQVRYEMLRKVRVEGLLPSEAARLFGFSRTSFYNILAAFKAGSLPGLMPRRRGPKGAHKLTGDVMEFVRQKLADEECASAVELAGAVRERFQICLHPRSIQRAIARKRGR